MVGEILFLYFGVFAILFLTRLCKRFYKFGKDGGGDPVDPAADTAMDLLLMLIWPVAIIAWVATGRGKAAQEPEHSHPWREIDR